MKICCDIDGTLTRFDHFILKNAPPYLKYKYALSIRNPQGFDLEQVFEISKTLEERGLSIEEAEIKSRKIYQDFWTRYYLKYLFTPFRPGITKKLKELSRLGNSIYITSSRKQAVVGNKVKEKLMDISILFQLYLNDCPYDEVYILPSDQAKIDLVNGILPDYYLEDKEDIIRGVRKEIKTICVDSTYNRNLTHPRVKSFTDNTLDKILIKK